MKHASPRLWFLVAMVVVTLVYLVVFDTQNRPEKVDLPELIADQAPKIKLSTGAAAGYVEDKTCATCHSDIYQSYQAVGMAKSFTTVGADKFIENFELPPFYHDKSQRFYQVMRNGDELTFQRWQLDDEGNPINVFKRKVDYILGSGHKTRVYLYQEPGGELFQFPIGWYTAEQQWGLSPGYDNAEHSGVTRQVQRQCMFCHNALPQVTKGSDEHYQPHVFPKTLPQGTGCQRCHGPGGKHVETVLAGAQSIEQIHSTIVNPAKLDVEKRDSVCFQCHMLPSVDLVGARDFSRNDYSFRPGENINDYIHHVDVVDARVKTEDRFEINHHAYRLRASKCFNQSEGALTCISCHNPHKKVPVAQRAEHYGKVCQSCHGQEHTPVLADNRDCVSCHMPQRRAQDVVRAVMTDHKIQKNNEGIDYLAPLTEQEPILEQLDFLMPEKAPQGDLGQIYKVVIMLRARVLPNYVDYLQSMLAKVQLDDHQPYFELTQAQLMLRRYSDAETSALQLRAKYPEHFRPVQWHATALMGQGRYEEAESVFQQLLAKRDDLAEIQFNYALLKKALDQPQAALAAIEKALSLRSNFTAAWFYRAQLTQQLGKLELAREYYKKVLSIDPAFSRGYLGLAQLLVESGDKAEAKRYLKQGRKSARQKAQIDKMLAELL